MTPHFEPGEEIFHQALPLHFRNLAKKALPLYLTTSELNYPPANLMLGSMYTWSACGISKDPIKGQHYLSKVSNLLSYFENQVSKANPSVIDIFLLGRFYEVVLNPPDYEMAAKYHLQAADRGVSFSQNSLGVCYDCGSGVPKSAELAAKYYKLSAEQGNAIAQFNVGTCYTHGKGVEKDYSTAMEYYRLAADQGYGPAQYNVGYCYEKGEGVEIDLNLAKKYYAYAADQGHLDAQYNLGLIYHYGKGTDVKEYELAVKYYETAAEKGHAESLNCLGDCYFNGTGVKRDIPTALKYYHLSADGGCATAHCTLGIIYEDGTDAPKDPKLAKKHYQLGADKGHSDCQYNLALVHHYGKGGEPENIEEAIKYYELSGQGTAQISKCYEKLGDECDSTNGLKKQRFYQLAADNADISDNVRQKTIGYVIGSRSVCYGAVEKSLVILRSNSSPTFLLAELWQTIVFSLLRVQIGGLK